MKKDKVMKIIDLDKMILNKETFNKNLENFIQKVIYENYDKRNNKIKCKLNNKIYECTIGNLLTQMILLIPFVELPIKFESKFVMIEKVKSFNSSTLTNYFNLIIKDINDNDLDNDETLSILKMSFNRIINIMSDISGKCNIYSGTTVDLRGILKLYMNNEQFRQRFDWSVPRGLDFSQIESEINSQFKDLMSHITNDKTNCYNVYFNADAGINKKQFKEVISKIGLKADLDGNMIPYVIDTNYIKGLRNIVDYFIVSLLARKALITSHSQVKNSGYLTRKLSLLLIDTTLDNDVEDCGTDEYLSVDLVDDETAKRYNMRYFLNEDGDLERFNLSDHKHLVGTTQLFRSPVKCKCEHGKVCHTCYGDLYKVNKDIHIGIVGVLELTEQLTQKLLSAKHLQTTSSEQLDWSEKFLEYFIVDKGSIYPDTSKEKSGIIILLSDEDYEISEDNEIEINSFSIKYKNGKEEFIKLPITLNPAPTTLDYIQNNPARDLNNRIMISFKNLCNIEDDASFTFILENNELSSSLKNLIDLIEKPTHLGISDIDEFSNKFIELLNVGGIRLDAVHSELITRQLVRRKCDLTSIPKRFDKQDDPTNEDYYVILKVSDAIYNSNSPAVSLSFERIKQQIQSPELYLKTGTSILDYLYFN